MGYISMIQLTRTSGGMFLAVLLSLASGSAIAGKNSGNGSGYNSHYRNGNGSMNSTGQAYGSGYGSQNSSHYRYQHQRRHQHNDSQSQWKVNSADSGNDRHSNEKYLNQRDFQAWLKQGQVQPKNQNQNRYQEQNMAQ